MKKTLLLIIITLLLSGVVMAQDSTSGTIGFAGLRYTQAVDTSSGLLGSIGLGFRLSEGSKLWTFAYTDVGQYGSLATELAYLVPMSSKLSVGPIAGPATIWSSEENPIAYLTGAAGLLVSYDITTATGLWTYSKYLFAGETQQGWVIGTGLYKRF